MVGEIYEENEQYKLYSEREKKRKREEERRKMELRDKEREGISIATESIERN